MSILIRGMEMPTSCWRCPLSQLYEKPREMLICKITHEEVLRDKIDGNCPLVPAPKHGRLIDADALCKTLRNLAESEYTPEVFANWIENHIDTIIPAEGRET